MKKVRKMLFSIVLLVLAIFQISTQMKKTEAATAGEIQYLQRDNKGFYSIQKWNGSEWIYVTYSITYYTDSNGVKRIAYCIDPDLKGIGWIKGEYVGYDVKLKELLSNEKLWRVYTNGYPYKTLEQLGVTSEQEAYIATKQAIYCYIYKTRLEQYSAVNDAGIRVINAMKTILDNAQNSTENFNNTNIEIFQSEKWNVDEIENKYISKKYEIKANINISKTKLILEGQPKGTKITNLQNQEKSEFDSNESFKILIPIDSLENTGEFKVKIQTQMETKPVIFGRAPNEELQNYALTAFSYENIDTELLQQYEKNSTEIIIQKQDKETKEVLKNAKFEILDINKNVIRVAETDERGQIILNKLIPGTYYIREVKAPEGYNLDMELHQIDISLNEKIVLKVNNDKIVLINNTEEPERPEEVKEPIIEKVEPVAEIPKLPITGM